MSTFQVAHGKNLDDLGELNGVFRNVGEPDSDYRARILERIRDFHATNLFDDEAQSIKPQGVLSNGQPIVATNKTKIVTGAKAILKINGEKVAYLDSVTIEAKISAEVSSQEKVKKCECGKEKHGFAKHSNWCDLASED